MKHERMRAVQLSILATALGVVQPTVISARPKATAGEPQFERQRSPFGPMVWVQVLTGPQVIANFESLDIATRYRITRRLERPIEPFSGMVRCVIERDGSINYYYCHPNDASDIERYDIVSAWFNRARPYLPTFRPIDLDRHEIISRVVELPVRFGRIEKPIIDFEKSELVDVKSVQGLRVSILAYPAAALREGVGGRMSIECVVQQDLTLICRQLGFDPIENTKMFTGAESSAFLGVKVGAVISDGRDAAGKRFKTTIRWAIPTE